MEVGDVRSEELYDDSEGEKGASGVRDHFDSPDQSGIHFLRFVKAVHFLENRLQQTHLLSIQVLQRIPREMLLILKTNDLLRAIEHQLGKISGLKDDTVVRIRVSPGLSNVSGTVGAAGRADGLIEMSKCVVYNYHQMAIKEAEGE